MSILIDGHNLIGQMDDLSLSDPEDEAKLVQRLRVYHSVINRPITVVFDHGERYVPPQGRSGGGVEVIFAALDSSADEVIIRRIKLSPNPQSLLVVSSDGDIQSTARNYGAQVMSAAQFAREMQHTHAPKKKRRARPLRESSVSPAEVQKWLGIFGDSPDE